VGLKVNLNKQYQQV